jgi:hypothetical protein
MNMKKEMSMKKKLLYAQIIDYVFSEITRECDPDNDYDNDDLHYNYRFDGYNLSNKNGYNHEVIVGQSLYKEGQDVFLVYVLYDTGDSFHREDNYRSDVGVFASMNDAKSVYDALRLINWDDRKDSMNYRTEKIKVMLPDAKQTYEVYSSAWMGYFEQFKSVEIETLHYNGKID